MEAARELLIRKIVFQAQEVQYLKAKVDALRLSPSRSFTIKARELGKAVKQLIKLYKQLDALAHQGPNRDQRRATLIKDMHTTTERLVV